MTHALLLVEGQRDYIQGSRQFREGSTTWSIIVAMVT